MCVYTVRCLACGEELDDRHEIACGRTETSVEVDITVKYRCRCGAVVTLQARSLVT